MSQPSQDQDAWTNALVLLAAAQGQDPQISAASIVHASYYAMFHAARACLLRHDGSAPKKHDRVIQQFGLMAKDSSQELRVAGRQLNEAWNRRLVADYKRPASITPEMALDTLQKATTFLDACKHAFGFAPP